MNVRTADGLVHLVLYNEDLGSYGETACLVDFARVDWERAVPPPAHVTSGSKEPDGEVLTCLTCIAKPHTIESRAVAAKGHFAKSYPKV